MSEPEKPATTTPAEKGQTSSTVVIDSRELFQGQRELWIEHDGVRYHLRITRRLSWIALLIAIAAPLFAQDLTSFEKNVTLPQLRFDFKPTWEQSEFFIAPTHMNCDRDLDGDQDQ